jgi:hypothetical protein
MGGARTRCGHRTALDGHGRDDRCAHRRAASSAPGPARTGDATLPAGDAESAWASVTSVLLAATRDLVLGGPSAAFGFLLADALLLVAILDVLDLAFLLVGVRRFITLRHDDSPLNTDIGQPDSGPRQHQPTPERAHVLCAGPPMPTCHAVLRTAEIASISIIAAGPYSALTSAIVSAG